MTRKIPLLLLLLLLSLTMSGAKKWRADNIEMVYLRDSTQYVCNPDGVLGQEAVQTANQVLRRLETDKGVQTVVVVVKQLEGDDPFTFGMDLSRRYGIGNKRNTGLIIILATEDRSYQILTGKGLEGTLPDAICSRVENRIMVPRLKKQEWDAAIVETVRALDQIIRGDDSIVADSDDDEADIWTILGMCLLVIAGCLVFIITLVYFSQKNCPKCGAKHSCAMSPEQIIIVNGRRRKRITWRCRKCGHTFTTETDDNNYRNGGNGIGPIFMGGPRGRSGGGFGGSFGGSFGGGSFGGGGAGGRF